MNNENVFGLMSEQKDNSLNIYGNYSKQSHKMIMKLIFIILSRSLDKQCVMI